MNKEETEFLEVARRILNDGIETTDRTGVGVKFIPGVSLKYDLTNNKLPLWTTRKIKWENQWIELIWFLRGQTDVKYLTDRGVNIWNSWTKSDGTIGPGYGKQWRSWDRFIDKSYVGVHGEERNYKLNQPIDQFSNLIEGIKNNPASRRHIVSLWNPVDVNECALPPCHGDVIQFIVDNNRGLHCIQYQRSADFCVGACPWQYTMLTHIVGKLTNTVPTSLTVMYGHCHIYLNQLDAVKEQLSRTPTEFPTMDILRPLSTISDVESLELKDIMVSNYNHQKFIKFPIAV